VVGVVTCGLGRISAAEHRLATRTWPTSFSADGQTPVTLVLTGVEPNGRSYGILDNLELAPVRSMEENMLVDPGFNNSKGPNVSGTWSCCTNNGSMYRDTDSFYRTYYGLSGFEGRRVALLVGDDMYYQPVTFPTGGLYRLSVNLKTRGTTAPNTSVGYNPVRAYLARGGVTNWVGESDNAATTNYNEYAFCFALPPEGGTYDVGFCGTRTGDHTTLLDAAWLCRVESEHGIALPEHLKINVAAGARLQLDFAGTNRVESLRIDGKSYRGLVSVETHPELFPTLSGPGTLDVVPTIGAMLIVF